MAQLLLEEIAAEVLGREIRKIIKDNSELLQRVQNILSGVLNQEEKSTFVHEMVAETGRTVNELLLWLEKMAKGLQ